MLINRQMAINYFKAHDNGMLWTTEDIIYLLEHLPSVDDDAVNCKDCKWWTNKYNLKLGQGECILFKIYPKGDDHCKMAEKAKRREE